MSAADRPTRRAVVCVRAGVLPGGAAEAVAEADGRVLLVGTNVRTALTELVTHAGLAVDAIVAEHGSPFAMLARPVADALRSAGDAIVIVPASPDGRDLAPVLAALLDRPFLDGAIQVHDTGATCVRWGGRVLDEIDASGPFVATLTPGVRGVAAPVTGAPEPVVRTLALRVDTHASAALTVAVLPPDAATMDLAEAPRIVGGGAGLDSAERFEQLASVAGAIGASMGGTRVITDRGWIDHARQIGTTGVAVDPNVYLAFGISGAVQHTAGLGRPDHVVSVNLDPYCPMMQRADLAIVADANEVLDALAARLQLGIGAARPATNGRAAR